MSAVTKSGPPKASGCFLDQQQCSYQSNQAVNSEELINSTIQAARNLVARYIQSPILLEECVCQAKSLIPGLTSFCSKNPYAAMEEFFSLLKLEQAEFQQHLLKELIPLLHGNFPLHGINARYYSQLMGLEATLGQLIENHIRSGHSIKTLILFLTLYQDILEHLWLLPCLQTSEFFPIDEWITHPIKCRVDSWLLLLKCEMQENKKLENSLTVITQLLSKLTHVSKTSLVLYIFKTKKWPFNPFTNSEIEVFTALIQIYFTDQNDLRAADYCLELASAYMHLRIWAKAEYYYKRNLKIAQKYEEVEQQAFSLKMIGMISFAVGDHQRADRYLLESLTITRDPALEQSVYPYLAQNYINLKKYKEADEYINKIRDLAGNDPEELALSYYFQGISCFEQEKYREALDWYQKGMTSCTGVENPTILQPIFSSIGHAHTKLGSVNDSIQAHSKSIEIAQKYRDPFGEAVGLCNIGTACLFFGELSDAEEHFRDSIKISSSIQQNLVENREWQITSFETHARSYMGLEIALIKQSKYEAALQIVENRRAQALNSALAKNLHLEMDHDKILSIQEIQGFAKHFQTTFVIYSLHTQFAWVISSTSFEPIELVTDSIRTEIENITGVLAEFPFYRSPGSASEIPLITHLQKLRGNTQADVDLNFVRKELEKDLFRWYEALIQPLEDYLPKDDQESLTFVPDGFLSQIPFGLFIDLEGKYLIEKHPIAFIPSLKTLYLLAKKEPIDCLKNAAVMGNPNTGNLKDNLDHSQKEAEALGELFELPEQQILLREQATSEQLIERMPEANLIFISCHGLGGKQSLVYNQDSIDHSAVFEGCLKLAPDGNHPKGYLSSKEISELKLTQAEFVCLSSCFSGTGSLWQEGSIGFVSSFLAAGAKTIMAAYWPVRDSELTVSMIEKMAKNMIEPKESRLTHQHALQCIMKEMIAKYPKQIEEWGVFFLTGI